MHLATGAWRNLILALALIALALPLATTTSTASAQTPSGSNPPAITDVASLTPALAFNAIGYNHTFTFNCNYGDSANIDGGAIANSGIKVHTGVTTHFPSGTPSADPGCYNVQLTLQNASLSVGAPITQAQCGTGLSVFPTGSSFNCLYLEPYGEYGNPAGQATVTMLGTAPYDFVLVATGYVPALCNVTGGCDGSTNPADYTCPAGTSSPGFVSGSFLGITGPGFVGCSFSVSAEKKYVEITKLTATPGSTCGGTVYWSEALKTYVGPACTVTFAATGMINLKQVTTCAGEPTGPAPASEYGPGATYVCNGNEFGVTGVSGAGLSALAAPSPALCYNSSTGMDTAAPVSGNIADCSATGLEFDQYDSGCPSPYTLLGSNDKVSWTPLPTTSDTDFLYGTCGVASNLSSLPLTITTTGFGPPTGVTVANDYGAFCSGGSGSFTGFTTNESITFCPTGFGPATVTACIGSPINTQPPNICATAGPFTFSLQGPARVVPQVKWAGEKTVLTKCFGGGGLMSGALVEFTLQGNNPGLNATLLPTSYDAAGTGVTAGLTQPSADTTFAVTDANGCASTILYASGEGQALVDAALYSPLGSSTPSTTSLSPSPIINEHAFEVFYLKFDHVDLENISATGSTTSGTGLAGQIAFLAANSTLPLPPSGSVPSSISVPSAPGTGNPAGGTYAIPLCGTDLVRAMVHGYFQIPGDDSGRPAQTVTIPGAPAGAAGSYVLPAGRWVLPEDWPVLATFAGFANAGAPVTAANNPASVYAWDLNSGFAFDPTEPAVLCTGPNIGPAAGAGPVLNEVGPISEFNAGPCFGKDINGTAYSTAPDCAGNYAGDNGLTVGIGPFDPTQACTLPFPLQYSPSGAETVTAAGGSNGNFCGAGIVTGAAFCQVPLGPNSTYLPNGFLSQWDAPMPPAQVTFGITSGPGVLDQVNKSALYQLTFSAAASAGTCPSGGTINAAGTTCSTTYYDNPFYAEAIPSSPLIPPVFNDGGYMWNSWGTTGGTTVLTTGSSSVATATTVDYDQTVCTNGATSDYFYVTDASAIVPGMTITFTTGNVTYTGVPVTSVTGSGRVYITCTSALQNGTAGTTISAGTSITSEQLAIAIPAGSEGLFVPGAAISIICNGTVVGATVASETGLTAANGTAYLDGAAAILTACNTDVLAAGTIIETGPRSGCANTTGVSQFYGTGTGACTGPGGEILAPPPNPYPFWQWVPSTPTGTAADTTGTVYSDNHGEAVVSLETGFALAGTSFLATGQQLPVPSSGVCPVVGGVQTVPAPNATAPTACLLPLSALAGLGFQNVASAIKAGAGCYATTTSGSFTPVTGSTVPANGPTNGQICVNSNGGVELGPSAALGMTTLQAVADYPYTRGEHAQISSGSLTKVFTSMFNKSVAVSAATGGTGPLTNYTVTITATDVCGTPLSVEPIEVFALTQSSGGIVLAPSGGTTGTPLSTNESIVYVSPVTGTATLSLEVLPAALGTSGVVIKVVFPLEGIERVVQAVPGTTTTGISVLYSPGWQMVGGPSGSNFSFAEAVFSYDTGTSAYLNDTASASTLSSAGSSCTGYWAYFAAPATITLNPTSKPGDTASCALAAGWNLVGNPFGSPATIPSGTTAYHWNGTSYDTVETIPTGGSVWIYESAATSLTLTAT